MDEPVNAGTYALSETNVAGYAAGDWSCVGGTQDGANITLALGGVGHVHDHQHPQEGRVDPAEDLDQCGEG